MLSSSLKISLNSLFKKHTGLLQLVLHSPCSTSADPPVYDLRYYKSPYDEQQSNFLLSILNKSSQNELLAYEVPKSIASKICIKRERRGKISNLEELPMVAEVGLKKIESICEKILKYQQDTDDKIANRTKSLNAFVKSVKPKLMYDYIQRQESIVGIILRGKNIAWCQIRRQHNNTEENSSTKYEFNNFGYSILADVMDNKDLCDQLMSSISQIPSSNIYAVTSKESLPDDVINASLQSQRTGILLAALSARVHTPDVPSAPDVCEGNVNDSKRKEFPNIYYIRETSAIKSIYKKKPELKSNPLISSLKNQLHPNLTTPTEVLERYNKSSNGYHSAVIDRALMLAYYLVMPVDQM